MNNTTTVKTTAGETLVTFRKAGALNLIVSATVNGVSVRDNLREEDVEAIEAAMTKPAPVVAMDLASKTDYTAAAIVTGNKATAVLTGDRAAIIAAACSFAAEVAATIEANYRAVCPNMVEAGVMDSARIELGRRYAKIIRIEKRDGKSHDRSAFGFVDLTNGNVLKAASWAKPADHARGNVLDIAGRGNSYTPYGINYRR